MTLTETRYRNLLRLLPSFYRAQHEDAMVDAYLAGLEPFDEDGPDAPGFRPGWREAASVVALAVRVRLPADPAAPVPAGYRLAGRAVRAGSVLAVVLHAAAATVQTLVTVAVLAGAVPAGRDRFWSAVTGAGPGQAVWNAVGGLTPLAWVAAYVMLARGRNRQAVVWAAIGCLPVTTWSVRVAVATGPDALLAASVVFAWLTVAALAVAFPSRAPVAAEVRGLLEVLFGGTVLVSGVATVAVPVPAAAGDGWAFAWSLVVVAAGWCVWSVLPHRARRRPARACPAELDEESGVLAAACAWVGLPVLAMAALQMREAGSLGAGSGTGAADVMVVLLVVAESVLVTRLVRGRLRAGSDGRTEH